MVSRVRRRGSSHVHGSTLIVHCCIAHLRRRHSWRQGTCNELLWVVPDFLSGCPGQARRLVIWRAHRMHDSVSVSWAWRWLSRLASPWVID